MSGSSDSDHTLDCAPNHVTIFSLLSLKKQKSQVKIRVKYISVKNSDNNNFPSAASLFSSLPEDKLCDNSARREEAVCRLLIHVSNESRLIVCIGVNCTNLHFSVTLFAKKSVMTHLNNTFLQYEYRIHILLSHMQLSKCTKPLSLLELKPN